MEKIENNYAFLSKKKSLTLIILILFGILSFSFFDANKIYPNLKLIGNITLIIFFILVFLFSDLRIQVINYLISSYFEAKKVVWPEKNEVFKITISVFLFVIFMGFFLWIVDTSLGWLVYDIILGWR